MRHTPEALERWAAQVFGACDVPAAEAALAASMLVRSELCGYRTHGMTRVASYVERLRAGDFNPRAVMSHRSFPGGIVLEADGAMGQIAGPRAVELGLEALRTDASVLIVVRECGHLGALGIHALLAAESGVFCVLGQRTTPMLSMEGFARAAIGHNPIAFGCPMRDAAPLVFDVACSVAARGHILLAAREGTPIPAGWALDEHGAPTTDAKQALKGALLPMGGHKGIGIAMMVESLAGAMAATAASFEPSHNARPESGAMGRQGAFFWLVRPGAFLERGLFDAYMAQWTGAYLEAGGDSARLPGSRSARLEREGRARGVELAGGIVKELSAVGERLGIAFPG